MICAWKELLEIIPRRLVHDVNAANCETLLEIRLRAGNPAELIHTDRISTIAGNVSREELEHCVNVASRYSPWAASGISRGYITASGGHRIGICGEAVVHEGSVTGIRKITSLCIRIAKDFPGIAAHAGCISDSTVIIGAPGWGKTTLLRDIIRSVSARHIVGVTDERGEIFPDVFASSQRIDILTGCPKAVGIEMLLRCMGPEYIAMDEITAEEDAEALLKADGSGVKLLATAHAGSLDDFFSRITYRKLLTHNVFKTALVLRPDKSYTAERIRA